MYVARRLLCVPAEVRLGRISIVLYSVATLNSGILKTDVLGHKNNVNSRNHDPIGRAH